MKKMLLLYIIISMPILASAATEFNIAHAYLSLWQSGDYSSMYDLLSSRSKQYISRGEFIDCHRDFARRYIIERHSIVETINLGQTAIVRYELTLTGINRPSKYQTGKLELVKENDLWRIEY